MKSSPRWTSEGNQMVLYTQRSELITTIIILFYGVPFRLVHLITTKLINNWYIDRTTYGLRSLGSLIYSEHLHHHYSIYQLTLTFWESQCEQSFRRPSSPLRIACRSEEIKSSYARRRRFWWNRRKVDRENWRERTFSQLPDESPK